MRRAIAAFVLAGASIAHAESSASVTVTLNDQGRQLASDLGLSVPDLIQHAKDRIDELYKVSRIDELLRAFGNTTSFSQRGLGVDYDVDPNDILVGAAAAGIHGDVAIGTTNELLGGSIINYAAHAGVNLGRWQKPRWTVFASGFYQTQTIHGLTGHLLTLGAHVQYQAVTARGGKAARWTGIAATTGLEYARLTMGTSSSIEGHFTAEGPEEHATIHMSSTGTLDVLTSTITVPVEVTSGVRFGGVFSIYGGGGLAIPTGNSTITAQLNSVLSINHDHLPVGDAVITGSGESSPSPVTVHALTGLEVHTRHVRVFLQGAFAPGETAAALGMRAAF
jgi:hypothetical protein